MRVSVSSCCADKLMSYGFCILGWPVQTTFYVFADMDSCLSAMRNLMLDDTVEFLEVRQICASPLPRYSFFSSFINRNTLSKGIAVASNRFLLSVSRDKESICEHDSVFHWQSGKEGSVLCFSPVNATTV